MAYDMDSISAKVPSRIGQRDALDPTCLIPSDLDQPVLGKKYDQNDVITTICTQLHRYSRSKSVHANPALVALGDQLREMFAIRYFKTQRFPKVSAALISKHMNPVIEKMTRNGGIFHDLNVSLRPLSETYTIHFFLKDIVKVVMSKSSCVSKVGQGISAWTKTLNALFCPLFRAIEECFKEALKPNVLFENAIQESDYDAFVQRNFDPSVDKHCRDFKEYDSLQDADTQEIEDILLEGFVDRKFLVLYRKMRLKAKQKSKACVLMNAGSKNSGEAATLFTNTILNMFLVCLSTKVRDVRCEMYKGDDSMINAGEVRIFNWLATLDPNIHLPMVADNDFPVHADFAGNWLCEDGIIPDILKIVCKHISKDFSRKSGYCEELGQALADKEKFLTHRKLLYLRRIYADLYGLTGQEFSMLMSTFSFYITNRDVTANKVGFSALVVNEACRLTDELTPAELDMKRRKNAYACTDDFVF